MTTNKTNSKKISFRLPISEWLILAEIRDNTDFDGMNTITDVMRFSVKNLIAEYKEYKRQR